MARGGSVVNFVREGLWAVDERGLRVILRGLLWVLRRIVITVECFIENKLYNYAASLTYNCLLAAIPVLSIIFAIAKGFGFGTLIEARIRENISASSDMADGVFDFINHYLEHTHSGVFLGVGLLLLLYTVIALTSNIEVAFNTIWHVSSSRNVYRQILNYAAIFLLFPLLIVVTSGFSVFMLTMVAQLSDYVMLSSTMGFVIKYTPMLLSCLCFVALYKFMPNTRVHWRAVLVPGFVAGCLFQLLQYLYIHYQLMLSSYNAIYGSFAALPLFMLWMQFSWYIALGGAEMSYAFQHEGDYIFAKNHGRISRREHDSLCLLLMSLIALRFRQGGDAPSQDTLARETGLPQALVQGIVEELVAVGLVSETDRGDGAGMLYQPKMNTAMITVDLVQQRLDTRDEGHITPAWTRDCPRWERLTTLRSSLTLLEGDTPVADLWEA